MRRLPNNVSRRLARIALLALLLGHGGAGLADERILSYHSDISIRADRSMVVAETIRVQAEGDRIRRGIFRDFPTSYRDHLGNRHVVDFDVLGIRRDGNPEPWFTESSLNGVRVYIGDRNRLLPPGEHEYRIEYRTDWQLGFFATHDELWWNVNGNGWGFPVDATSARIRLPQPVAPGDLAIEGWVGRLNSTETSVTTAIESGDTASIEATRTLLPGENLSFTLTWPKGLISPPTALQRAGRLLFNNRGLLVALLALAANLVYWLGVWSAYGRDPARGTIFPHYAPPDAVSPATARYLSRMAYDRKAFSAAIINLAVKGYIEINEDDGDYGLRRLDGGTAALAPGEAALLRELFATGDVLALEQANHARIRAAMRAHRSLLKRDNYRIHFSTNGIYVLPALAILGVGIILVLALNGITIAAVAVTIVNALLVPVFAFLMRAHTPAGRRLLDRIEGFRLYLDVAEKDELELRHPPEMTPALFEAFLPYALALDVEQRWAERFTASLSTEQAAAYRPFWYHGTWNAGHGGLGSIGASTAALTGAVTSSIAAAATPPGSSSGAGGGGFSGGGGGGGGGGGW